MHKHDRRRARADPTVREPLPVEHALPAHRVDHRQAHGRHADLPVVHHPRRVRRTGDLQPERLRRRHPGERQRERGDNG